MVSWTRQCSLSRVTPAERVAIFYCIIFDTPPTWRAKFLYLFPQERSAQLNPRTLGSLFVASYDSLTYSGDIPSHLHTRLTATLYNSAQSRKHLSDVAVFSHCQKKNPLTMSDFIDVISVEACIIVVCNCFRIKRCRLLGCYAVWLL
jgi:hypothetical protein